MLAGRGLLKIYNATPSLKHIREKLLFSHSEIKFNMQLHK